MFCADLDHNYSRVKAVCSLIYFLIDKNLSNKRTSQNREQKINENSNILILVCSYLSYGFKYTILYRMHDICQ